MSLPAECTCVVEVRKNPEGDYTACVELCPLHESAGELFDAIKLYAEWAERTGDYPHDETGCEAHEAIVEAYSKLSARMGKQANG